METEETLLNDRREFENVSADVVKKIKKTLEVCSTKIYKIIDKLQRDLKASNVENSTLKTTLVTAEANVKELREQLNTANNEVSLLTELVKSEELRNEEYRKKHNELVDENNRLKEVLSGRYISINRLQSDLESLKQQSDTANFDECQSEAADLKKIFQETTEKFDRFESTIKVLSDKHQLKVTEKNKTIEKLISELKATEAEKQVVFDKIKPKASPSNRMPKDSLPLQEIYSRYHDSLKDVHRLEMECLQLNAKLECSTVQLHDTTSNFEHERENSAKMLSAEKDNLNNVTCQLTAMANEKAGTEVKLCESLKLLHKTSVEKKKAQDDLNALKQQNVRLTQEIAVQMLKKDDEIKAAQSELKSKNNQLVDIKNKEVQIRRVAKKYKDSYFNLQRELENRQAALAAKSLEEQAAASNDAGTSGLVAARAETEKLKTKEVEYFLWRQDEQIAGPSTQTHGSFQIPVATKKRKADDDACTTNASVDVESAERLSELVSLEGQKAPVVASVQVKDVREAESSVLPRNTRSRRRRRFNQHDRGMSTYDQRSNQAIWDPAQNFSWYHRTRYHP